MLFLALRGDSTRCSGERGYHILTLYGSWLRPTYYQSISIITGFNSILQDTVTLFW